MTNQQGAPEALRLAEEITELMCSNETAARTIAAAADELCRLHYENERLAAMVEAQQPAPSAAAAPDGWESVIHEIRSGLVDSEPSGYDNSGYRSFAGTVLDAVEDGLLKLAAPQPSPTAQVADSQPAPVRDEREAFEAWYCDQMRAAGYNADDGIANLREGNHYGEHRVMLNGKWEGWQARAARAPADSVTAPAGGGVVGWLPVHFNGHGFYGGPLKTEAEANQYIAQVHQSSDSVTLTARPFAWVDTTPPAQAADSVLEDAARWQFVESAPSATTLRLHNLRPDQRAQYIDAARKQGGA